MSLFKARAVLLLSVIATAASAITGYQAYTRTPAPLMAAAASQPPAVAAKQGELAYISPALRREINALKAGESTGVFVHFTPAALAQRHDTLKRFGLAAVNDYQPWADSVFATGSAAQLLAIATDPGVYFLEQNEQLQFHNHTANWAIRTRIVQERVGLGPYFDATGNILTGKGIGVAMIDSGADGRHPDFQHALKRNYKVLPVGGVIDVGLNGSSDTTGGHGVHVGGTIMGDGSASTVNYPDAEGTPYIKGSFAGVAPDVSFYAYGSGETISVALATQAFQHILANYDDREEFPEAIRVINNSWGASGGEYAPTSTTSQIVKQLVAKGVTVVFSAGNSGDATDNDTTSPTCKDTTPGVICVASYSDLGTGSLNGVMSNFTSQGPFNDASKYPDISAPGQEITSTCSTYLPICKNSDPFVPVDTAFQPYYGTISGTSMATPHTVGAIALLLQARPDLTPDQVERLLQDTARKITDNVYGADHATYVSDPQNPAATINYRAGAGLLDLPRALDTLGVAKIGSLPADVETTVISGDANAAGGADDGSQNAIGANDFVKLTVQHENLGGVQGLAWRISVADASDLVGASFVRYQVLGNIDGKPFSTAGTLTADGFTADGLSASTTAVATNASKDGNVLRLFVPLAALGSPPIGAPAHNLRVVVTSDLNGTAGEVDYAPSGDPVVGLNTLTDGAQSGLTTPLALSAIAPGFGKPFTILREATSAGAENRCEVPGLTLLNDAGGDSLTTDSNQDLLSASVAQPYIAGGNPNLVFTLKVSSLALLKPGSGYFVSFKNPDDVVVGVRMEVNNPLAPAFYTYTAGESGGTPPVADGRFVSSQTTAAAGSRYDADTGTITIVATPAALGLTTPGQSLVGFNSGATQTTDPTNMLVGATLVTDEMPDGLGRIGRFEYKANGFCAPNSAPTAVLGATPTSGAKPLTVSFSGLASTDPDTAGGDAIASYTFNFGDGSAPVTNTTGTISYVYTRSGSFTATLKVKDRNQGAESLADAKLITVSNDAPVAALAVDKTSGNTPLTVAFDATGSTDPNGDAVTLFSFDLDGDGSYEIVDSDNAKPSFTYSNAGTYTAKVKVKDSEGLESAAATRSITVTTAPPPASVSIRSFTATFTDDGDVSDGHSLVNFSVDASSSDPAAGTLSYTFDYGDGTGSGRQAGSTSSHDYTRAGSYEAKVIVTDERGNSATRSVTVKTTTTVVVGPGPVTARLAVRFKDGNTQVPSTVTLDGSGSTSYDGAIYRFSFGDGSTDQVGTSRSATHAYTTAGSYTVTLTVTDKDDASNTSTATGSVTTTALQQTVAQLTINPSRVRVGDTVSFDASASIARTGQRITGYRFDFGDGTVIEGSSATVEHVYQSVGSFQPSVTVTDDEASTSTSKALVKVDAAPSSPGGGSIGGVVGAQGSGGALPLWTLAPLLLAGLRRRRRA